MERQSPISNTTLTLDQRVKAIYEAGFTKASTIHRGVTRTVRVSYRTIAKKVKKLKEGNEVPVEPRKKRSDTFLTQETAMEIENYLDENPFASAKDILQDLDYNVSDRTIQRSMKDLGFSYLPVKKQFFLTTIQKMARIDFANAHVNTDWGNIIFVDETSIHAFGVPKMAYQRKGERICHSVPKYPEKVHVWGGISSKGKTDIYIFEETLTGEIYQEILRDCLLPSARRLYSRNPWTLVQDNDPKHTCKIIKSFINDRGINLLDWPSSSPDLNPMENIWEILKVEVSKQGATNKDELIDSIVKGWEKISQKDINSCIGSMNTRLQAIIENRGEKISY